jgi:hypothetical protein
LLKNFSFHGQGTLACVFVVCSLLFNFQRKHSSPDRVKEFIGISVLFIIILNREEHVSFLNSISICNSHVIWSTTRLPRSRKKASTASMLPRRFLSPLPHPARAPRRLRFDLPGQFRFQLADAGWWAAMALQQALSEVPSTPVLQAIAYRPHEVWHPSATTTPQPRRISPLTSTAGAPQ